LVLRVDFVAALRSMMNVVGPSPCRPQPAAVPTLIVGELRSFAWIVVTKMASFRHTPSDVRSR
jgi:hypothetical protein